MIEKFPFMLRFSKHSESFFNSLLNSEPRKASVHLVMHYSTVSKLLATQDSRPYLLSDRCFAKGSIVFFRG
jgi:hypothetical protein